MGLDSFENIVDERVGDQGELPPGEMITGSDFKRMVRGVYSELLLSADDIDDAERRLRPGSLRRPGRDLCRTMAPAAQLLARSDDDSIGGLARVAASVAFLAARGSAGVMLASLLRGLAKGLNGVYEATDSQVGRAFQYGILYAQRALVVEEEEPDEAIVQAARAMAKSAHDAVRGNLPVLEILAAARAAAEPAEEENLGQLIMRVFIDGCQHGLDGSFVSPTLAAGAKLGELSRAGSLAWRFGISLKRDGNYREVKYSEYDNFCLNFDIIDAKADAGYIEKNLAALAGRVEVLPGRRKVSLHVHTARPGKVIERCTFWGPVENIRLSNMAEPHSLPPARVSLLPVAVLAVTEDQARVEQLQEKGAHIIAVAGVGESISVGTLVDACHSDLADSYIIVGYTSRLTLILRQVRYLMGDRVRIVLAASDEEQLKAIAAFDPALSAGENEARMSGAIVRQTCSP